MFDELQAFVNLLQYGAWAAIISFGLLIIVLICGLSLEAIVPIIKENNTMLRQILDKMSIPLPPKTP